MCEERQPGQALLVPRPYRGFLYELGQHAREPAHDMLGHGDRRPASRRGFDRQLDLGLTERPMRVRARRVPSRASPKEPRCSRRAARATVRPNDGCGCRRPARSRRPSEYGRLRRPTSHSSTRPPGHPTPGSAKQWSPCSRLWSSPVSLLVRGPCRGHTLDRSGPHRRLARGCETRSGRVPERHARRQKRTHRVRRRPTGSICFRVRSVTPADRHDRKSTEREHRTARASRWTGFLDRADGIDPGHGRTPVRSLRR